jgi:hypothetical protein
LEEDYDSDGRVRLSEEYRRWLEGRMNPFGEELVLREAAETLRVLEPLEGTVFFWDPDLPRESQTVALSASGAGKAPLQWECESAPVVWRGGQPRLELREGIHVVRVREPGSNRTAQARVEVRPL